MERRKDGIGSAAEFHYLLIVVQNILGFTFPWLNFLKWDFFQSAKHSLQPS